MKILASLGSAALCGSFLIYFTNTGWALDLVRDGQPVVSIVASSTTEKLDAPSKPRGKRRGENENDEATAVQVLVEWIKKMTDAELPVTNRAAPGSRAIFIGQAAVEAGLKLDDIVSPSREGLRIVADDSRVLLAGQSQGATLKAVCRFLEELGCRYFMDGPLGEVYPRGRTLSVSPLSITEKPGLLGRNPKGPSWNARLWKAWNGAGGQTFQHQHAWGSYVKESLFAEHPEFFAMGADGQRKPGGWLCTSNKELRRYFAERVIEAIRNGTRNPSLSPTDGRGYCQCPACKAQDDPKLIEPSSGIVSISSRYVDFFDDVARQVGKVYPESVLSFYCYADYTQPPALNRKLSPNLCAVIAPIRYCRLHEIGHGGCVSREQQVAMVDGWGKIASRLGYYNYMYNLADATLPFFKFTPCQKEFPYLHEKGLCMMTIEVLSNWQIYGPQIYLSLRLAYDPSANAEAIMEDYWQKFYGPKAGPFMKEYWMGIDREVGRLHSHAGGFFGLRQIYTPGFLQACQERLAKAAEAARGEAIYEQRVALHAEGFQSAVDYQNISQAMGQGDFAQGQKVYDGMISRLRALGAKGWANPEYGTAYLERFLSKNLRAGVGAATAPNKLLQVLPERWRFALDEENRGLDEGWHKANFADGKWAMVSTWGKTLDAQGYDKNTVLWYRTKFAVPEKHGPLALFFTEVDGWAEVFLNGEKVTPFASGTAESSSKAVVDGRARPRLPFEASVSDAVHAGENVVAVRVDHAKITELSLGGILRPVLLVEKNK